MTIHLLLRLAFLTFFVSWSLSQATDDWLLVTPLDATTFLPQKLTDSFVLSNGIIARTLLLNTSFQTTGFVRGPLSFSTNRVPEVEIRINGRLFIIGHGDGIMLEYLEHRVHNPHALFHWEQGRRHTTSYTYWPPRGLTLEVDFAAPTHYRKFFDGKVTVSYEMYNSVPVLSKWVTVHSYHSNLKISRFVVDQLLYEGTTSFLQPTLDQTVGAALDLQQDGVNVHFTAAYQDPNILLQPSVRGNFTSFRVYLTLQDSIDKLRTSLTRKQFQRVVTPQTVESPLVLRLKNADFSTYAAVLQDAVRVGVEMIWVPTEPSDLTSAEGIARLLLLSTTTRTQGIEFGLVVKTGHLQYRQNNADACESIWMLQEQLLSVATVLGIGGYAMVTDEAWNALNCYAAKSNFYSSFVAQGIMVSSSETGFSFAGVGKTLVRSIHRIETMADFLMLRDQLVASLTDSIPSAIWVDVDCPLNCTLYDMTLSLTLGNGIATSLSETCLDESATHREILTHWTSVYHRYPKLLTSNCVRLPIDGTLDVFMHFNPTGYQWHAFALVINTSPQIIEQSIVLPLYYAAFDSYCAVREMENAVKLHSLGDDFTVRVSLQLRPYASTYFVFELPVPD